MRGKRKKIRGECLAGVGMFLSDSQSLVQKTCDEGGKAVVLSYKTSASMPRSV